MEPPSALEERVEVGESAREVWFRPTASKKDKKKKKSIFTEAGAVFEADWLLFNY